jgi:hypothetical protein
LATRISQERNNQKSFISIDTSSPLSTNLQLAQWPIGYKFNMIPTFNGESDPRQFLMSFEAPVIAGGGDETTLAKSLVMAVKGLAQHWSSSLKSKSIHSWEQRKTVTPGFLKNKTRLIICVPRKSTHMSE